MRTSVKVKNFIAKMLIAIGILLVIGGVGGLDTDANFKSVIIIEIVGMVTTKFGWELLKW